MLWAALQTNAMEISRDDGLWLLGWLDVHDLTGIIFLAVFSVKLDFHPSNILPNSMAFYTPENMANTHFLHHNGDMEGTGQKGFLVHVILLSRESLGFVPPPPPPSPPSALGFHLPAPLLREHLFPGQAPPPLKPKSVSWSLWHESGTLEN